MTKALEGHFKKAGANPVRFLREVRLKDGGSEVKVGDKVLVEQFAVDEFVDVTGVSKGRGFAGVHKRHHFGGGGRRARLDVPPRAGIDWRFGVSFARVEGHARCRTHGR